MSRTICCQRCRSSGEVTEQMEGRLVRCSGCAAEFVVSAAAQRSGGQYRHVIQAEGEFMADHAPSARSWTPKMSWLIVTRAAVQWWNHEGPRMGASLAFYAVFSATPLLWLAISVAGAVFSQDSARAQVHTHLVNTVNEQVADYVNEILQEIYNPSDFPSIAIGIVIFLYASSAVFLEARSRLCMICQLDPPSSTALAIVRRYGEAIAVVTLVTLLLTGSLICRALLHGIGAGWAGLPLSYVVVTLLLAGIYRILSTNRIAWGFCCYGALITCALLLLGRALIQGYLLNFPVRGAYGQAGFLMALMLWIYYSAQVFYFGAELIQARRTWPKWAGDHVVAGVVTPTPAR